MVTSLFVVLMALVILAIVVRLVEARVAFFPSAGEDVTPSEFEVPYTADYVMSADGERLRVWALPREEARASVVYFHGNGGNLSIWAPILAGIHREGYAVYAIDYRGYGLSTGRPSERGLFRDVDAFVPWARDRVPAGLPVVYWGRSL